MSHYGDYIKERENYEIIEDERGFATFIANGEECYIRDIYVSPDFRHDHVATFYANHIVELVKPRGVKKLIGSVCTTANYATESMKVLLAYGFKLRNTYSTMIYFEKEI